MGAAVSSACGAGYAVVIDGRAVVGATIGFMIGGILFAIEMFVIQGRAGERLRRLPLYLFLIVSTIIWGLVIVVCLEAGPRLFGLGEYGSPDYHAASFTQDLIFAFSMSFVLNFGMRIRALVGGRVLNNFLVGRYHRPLREQRIFMFLDLVGSTRLSEELGDLQVQSLIARFFFEIASPILEHGGETHRYIGDEIVVTWPLGDAARNARCVRCVADIAALVRDRADWFRSTFGVVPAFRVGLHGGPVVASEVGDTKLEIVYFGDTINTAARLGALCKEVDRNVLISDELLSKLELPAHVCVESLGGFALRGKAELMAVSALQL